MGRVIRIIAAGMTVSGLYSVVSPVVSADNEPMYNHLIDNVLDGIAGDPSSLQFGTVSGEWSVIALARSGKFSAGDEIFSIYRQKAADTAAMLEDSTPISGALNKFKSTENSRLILALSAIGEDPADFGGIDLLSPYEDFDWVVKQGVNGCAFALIAFDSCGYSSSDVDFRKKCVDYLLERQLDDGGWAAAGERSDPDITAIVLQAFSRYTDDPAISAAIDRGIAVLSSMQTENGGFKAFGGDNSNSTAQVIIACAALGIDPDNDERFVKNGISAYDALLDFYNNENGDFSRFYGESGDAMATEQSALALVAYDRFLQGKNYIYDMSDVVKPWKIVCICSSDGVDIIPENKMEIAVIPHDIDVSEMIVHSLGDIRTEFYYSPEISEKIGEAVYIALADIEIGASDLTNPENYSSVSGESEFFFGDADGNGIINAQDSLYIVDIWMKRVESKDNRMLLLMDVNGDGRLNISDAESVKNYFVNETSYEITDKIVELLKG